MEMTSLQMVMLGGGAFVFLIMLSLAFTGPSVEKAGTRRLDSIKDRHSASAASIVDAQLRKIRSVQPSKTDGFVGRMIPKPEVMRKRIAMTGKSWTLAHYLVGTLIVLAIVMAFLMFKGAPIMLSVMISLFFAMLIPHLVVGYYIKKRLRDFTSKFPDAIDLMVRGLRSGLPISETLGIVATEVPGPVGVEFRGVTDRIRIGRTMDASLQDTADRLGTPEFQFFCITLAIQRETGGNLAETLSNLSDVLRKRAQMKLKIKAMSSESKASAYIVGSLPFIVFGLIWMVNPDYLAKFFVDPRLMMTGGGGLVWMSLGAYIMSVMVSFEI
jgi:tight adherence protein B